MGDLQNLVAKYLELTASAAAKEAEAKKVLKVITSEVELLLEGPGQLPVKALGMVIKLEKTEEVSYSQDVLKSLLDQKQLESVTRIDVKLVKALAEKDSKVMEFLQQAKSSKPKGLKAEIINVCSGNGLEAEPKAA